MKTRTNAADLNSVRVVMERFIPDTKFNQRVRDEKLKSNYDYAHAVIINGIQRATWKKRGYAVGWELVDIDGDTIKTPRVNTYTDRATKRPVERHYTAAVHISNIESGMRTVLEVVTFIPTPQQMKTRRVKALKDANKKRLANHKVDCAQAKQDAAGDMYAALINIVGMDHAGGASLRGIARGALAKVKLPRVPDLKEAPGDAPGTWLLSAGRLYSMKGK